MTCAPDLSPAPISLLWTFSSTSMSFFDCTQGLNCSSSLVQPHQCQVQGTIPALLLLTTLLLIVARMPRAQLAHVRHVNQDLRVLSHQAPFQAVYPKPVIFHKVVFTQGQDLWQNFQLCSKPKPSKKMFARRLQNFEPWTKQNSLHQWRNIRLVKLKLVTMFLLVTVVRRYIEKC